MKKRLTGLLAIFILTGWTGMTNAATVVIDGVAIGWIRGFAELTDTRLEGSGPLSGLVVVGANIGILVWTLVGDVGHTFIMLCIGVLHGTDRFGEAVVGKVVYRVSRGC